MLSKITILFMSDDSNNKEKYLGTTYNSSNWGTHRTARDYFSKF